MFRALALRFERFFNFRVLRDPSVEKMQRLKLPSNFAYQVPGLLVLVLENFQDPARHNFYAVQFDKTKMGGELNYASALMFLLQINSRFRSTLPEDNGAADLEMVRADEVLREERKVFEIREELLSVDPHQHSVPAPGPKDRQEL